MLLKPLSVAAAGFAVASAFLLPPDVTAIDIPELTDPFKLSSQSLGLRCPGCPMVDPASGADIKMTSDIPNHLKLDFSIDSNRLLVNGFELYPNVDPLRIFQASQVADAQEERPDFHLRKHPKPSSTRSQPIGYSLGVKAAGVDKTTGLEAIMIDLQIIEVMSTFVDGIPNVHIKLIKAADGSLIMASVEATRSRSHMASYKSKMEKCTSLLCKWKVLVAAHLEQFKPHGCAMKGKFGHKGHKGHAHPGMHHHHPHRPQFGKQSAWEGHTWHKLGKQLVKYVLYPIILGMVVGVAVCLIGMSVGTLIIACWRIFVRRQTPADAFNAPFRRRCRRHRRSSRAHKAVATEVAVTEEKSSLLEHQEDAPPVYSDEDNKKAEV